ncbi:MAG: hypothetical protein L0Z70_00880, partial [Chloroflexi bacterium]|nr:hypothetical protein [Chloroflexota bacterium]
EFIDLPGETGKYLAMAGDGYLKLLDVTHPLSTTILTSTYIDCVPYDLTTKPGLVYVACDLVGGRWYLASTGELDLEGWYRYPYAVQDVSVSGDFIYMAAGGEGLFEVWHALTSYVDVPTGGGLLNSEFYTLTLDFAADTFTDSVGINLVPRFYGNMPNTLETIGAKYYFDLSISNPLTPLKPYQVAWQYDPAEFPGLDETTLGLYYWDGDSWVKEPSSNADPAANLITASPQHASLWAILAEQQALKKIYLPMLRR